MEYKTLMKEYLNKMHLCTIDDATEDSLRGNVHDYVYLLYNPLNKQVKIGRTQNLQNRLKQLRTQGGCNYNLIVAIDLETGYDENSEWLEAFLHEHFKDKRRIGEWFELSVRDVVAIRSLIWYVDGQDIEDNTKELYQLLSKGQNLLN